MLLLHCVTWEWDINSRYCGRGNKKTPPVPPRMGHQNRQRWVDIPLKMEGEPNRNKGSKIGTGQVAGAPLECFRCPASPVPGSLPLCFWCPPPRYQASSEKSVKNNEKCLNGSAMSPHGPIFDEDEATGCPMPLDPFPTPFRLVLGTS